MDSHPNYEELDDMENPDQYSESQPPPPDAQINTEEHQLPGLCSHSIIILNNLTHISILLQIRSNACVICHLVA